MKKILSLFLCGVMLFGSLFCFSGCSKSEKDHLEEVKRRVEKTYMGEGSKYTSFEVFPLYTVKDKLGYVLVEFQPTNFLYVKINKRNLNCVGRAGFYTQYPFLFGWERNTINEFWDEKGYPRDDQLDYLEKDENGKVVYHTDSHYKVAGIENERRYLLKVIKEKTFYVPAVKRGDKYLDLVSMREFEYIGEKETALLSMSYISFIMHKTHYDL